LRWSACNDQRADPLEPIQHPTEATVTGPFLIDRAQLESLDSIVNSEWTRLEDARNRELTKYLDDGLKKYRGNEGGTTRSDADIRSQLLAYGSSDLIRSSRSCVLTLKGGRSAHVSDFASALRDPGLSEHELTGFIVRVRSGAREFKRLR
jgi:hypothetical protein